jgi:hypothetical protein
MPWPVYEDYTLEGELLTPRGRAIRQIALDKPGALLRDFHKLGDGDLADLLQFVKRWGLLGAENAPQTEGSQDPDNPPMEQESIQWIWAHRDNVRLIMEIWPLFRKRDERGLRQIFLRFVDTDELDNLPVGWRPRLTMHIPTRRHGEFETTELRWSAAMETAQEILSTLVNYSLPSRTYFLDGRPLALRAEEWARPLDAMYWHLAEAIAYGWQVKPCKACHEPFVAKDPRQLYCPAPPESKSGVSRCQARVNKRAKRARARLRE